MTWLSPLLQRRAPVDEARWVVLDVETSGLDAQRDALLAVAAIALRVDWRTKTLRVDLGDSFEVVLQQEVSSSKDNILLHGIGTQRQREGAPAAQALSAFVAFCGQSPLLAFHAAFDQTLLQRYCKAQALPLSSAWLDIEHLCAATHSEVRARALDEWLAHFGIVCSQRHQAAADTLAECELLQRVWPSVAAQCSSWREVRALAAKHRWLKRQ
jgi:DNA polymerase III subunit epsilon